MKEGRNWFTKKPSFNSLDLQNKLISIFLQMLSFPYFNLCWTFLPSSPCLLLSLLYPVNHFAFLSLFLYIWLLVNEFFQQILKCRFFLLTFFQQVTSSVEFLIINIFNWTFPHKSLWKFPQVPYSVFRDWPRILQAYLAAFNDRIVPGVSFIRAAIYSPFHVKLYPEFLFLETICIDKM